MNCECGEKTVFENKCKTHFIENFENKVYSTIEKYNLIKKGDKVAVAVSGGKDSITVLHLLSKKYDVSAIAVDEGIQNYRAKTLKDLKEFCDDHGINLKIVSVKEHFGMELDNIVKNSDKIPCTMCGIARRYILNLEKEFDIIATGHNLDDEAQSIMMNLMKHQTNLLARLGPKSGVSSHRNFVQRIKPLYFCTEKEVMAYTLLKGWKLSFDHCPYSHQSFRAQVRDMLNEVENEKPGFKLKLVENYLELLPKLHSWASGGSNLKDCIECGSPTSGELCKACEMKKSILVSQ